MQTIPVRKLPEYREAIISQHGMLTKADVAQQEPRILAYESQDAALLKAFETGEDIHLTIARAMYDDPTLTKADKTKRDHGKALGLGTSYGLTAKGLALRTGKTEEQATAFLEAYFHRFRGVQSYITKMRQQVQHREHILTAAGHKIWVNNHTFQAPDNAINAPIQGGAADLQKLWLVNMWKGCKDKGWPFWLNLAVHDELVCDHPSELKSEVSTLMEDTLRQSAEELFGTQIPFPAELGSGLNWRNTE
jgi:DNA polymerase-1